MLFNLMFVVIAVNQVTAMSINPEQPAEALLSVKQSTTIDPWNTLVGMYETTNFNSTEMERAKNLIQSIPKKDLNKQNGQVIWLI